MLLCTCKVCVVTFVVSELEEVWDSELLHEISCHIALPVLGYNKAVGIFPCKYPVQILCLRLGGKKVQLSGDVLRLHEFPFLKE